MNQFKLYSTIVFSSALLFGTNTAFAAFDVNQTNNGSSSNQVDTGSYGNSQTTGFRKAMHSGEMSTEEQETVTSSLPSKDTEVWYARARLNLSKDTLSRMKNKSTGAFSGLTLTQTSVSKHDQSFDVAVGYVFPQWRVEFEYIFVPTYTHTPTPLFVGGAGGGLSTRISTNTFLFNGYYEFLTHDRLKPYVFAGLGFAVNKAISTFNGASGPKYLYGLAGSIGAGSRFKIIDKVFLDAAFRYSALGNFAAETPGNLKVRGTRSLAGVSIGLLFTL